MKKRLVLIYSWIIISFLAQVLLYLFIDKVFLGSRVNMIEKMKFVKIEGNENQVKELPEEVFEIPQGSADVKISFDGSTLAYILDKKLIVQDIESSNILKTISNEFVLSNSQQKIEGNITNFQWIPNKNTLIYGISSDPSTPARVQFFTYDVSSSNYHIGVTLTEAQIPRGSELTDMVISPLTMVYYAKIKINDTQSKLFRIDLMDQVFPSITISNTATTKIGTYSEDFCYDDSAKLMMKSGLKSAVSIPVAYKACLLEVIGVDKEGKDKIYLGELSEEGKVLRIHFGINGSDISTWSIIELEKPQPKEDILISAEGKAFLINTKEGSLIDIKTNKKVLISGKLLLINKDMIIYRDKNLIKFKPSGNK